MTPTATPTATPTPSPTPAPLQLLNISGRLLVQTGDNVGIGGFIIQNTSAKRVIIRAIGPSLSVNGALLDPVLELHASNGSIFTNDNWRDTQEQEINQSGLTPTDNRESAIIATLPAGNHTAIIRGANGTSGIGLIEVYDLQTNSGQLVNLSVRANVQGQDNVLIDGVIVRGGAPNRVLFRAIGPSLPVLGRLQDPVLELRDADGNLLRSNDDWRDAPNAAEIQSTGIAPSDNRESAILLPLSAGTYTTIVRGVNGTTGIALAEAYQLNN